MSIHAAQLESLLTKLNALKRSLRTADRPRNQELADGDALVRAAKECDFYLPTPLTIQTLSDVTDKKIQTVMVLLERARKHEELPPDAQTAAEQEYLMTEEDLQVDQMTQDGQGAASNVAGTR